MLFVHKEKHKLIQKKKKDMHKILPLCKDHYSRKEHLNLQPGMLKEDIYCLLVEKDVL